MQLNPARGRKPCQPFSTAGKQTGVGLCSSTPRGDGNMVIRIGAKVERALGFMQLNPARGRKHLPRRAVRSLHPHRFMQLNPARGRKHLLAPASSRALISRFMQLNPARGRKRGCTCSACRTPARVYAAQPREGTETSLLQFDLPFGIFAVYAAQPREGTETFKSIRAKSRYSPGLCSSTPRGDGNLIMDSSGPV